MSHILLVSTLLLIFIASFIKSDLPVHCEFPSIKGKWRYEVTPQTFGRDVAFKCAGRTPIEGPVSVMDVVLKAPNVAEQVGPSVSAADSTGTFTLVYDQGFQLNINGNAYYTNFNFTQHGKKVTSYCHETLTGFFHTDEQKSDSWGCFRANKIEEEDGTPVKPQRHTLSYDVPPKDLFAVNALYKAPEGLVSHINSVQKSWVADENEKVWDDLTIAQVKKSAGSVHTAQRRDAHKRHMAYMKKFSSVEGEESNDDLPTNFTWRHFHNISYVPDVRNQGNCGSCYSFGTTGSAMARYQIEHKKTVKFSPQDILSCASGETKEGSFNQRCEGGFPFLTSHYARQFGYNREECFPYQARGDIPCDAQHIKCQKRSFVNSYEYLGGYYGASTERLMMKDIYHYGPLVVNMFVYNDLFHYKGGIYHHVKSSEAFAPEPHFEATNHIVFITGWGVENGEKFWEVQNSWGTDFGVNGYFKIVRGQDECAIESMTLHFTMDE